MEQAAGICHLIALQNTLLCAWTVRRQVYVPCLLSLRNTLGPNRNY